MTGGVRLNIVIGMPEQTLVVFCSIIIRLVPVNINDMSGQIICQLKPSMITTFQVLANEAVNGIVLIVVMRYEALND